MNKSNTNIEKTMRTGKPKLIMPDKAMQKHIAEPWLFKIETGGKHNTDSGDMFLILSLSKLDNKMTKEFDSCKAIFVQSDIDANAILDKLDSKTVRSKLYLFEKWQDLNRILRAWCDGVQDDAIATAWVEYNCLAIKNCALKIYRIPFKTIPALAKIPVADRSKFKIQQFGHYLHWTNEDIHLEIDTVKYHCDKKYKDAKDIEKITYYKNYGQAIAAVRKQYGLTQKHIEQLVGLSARQLYRIENGEQRPTIKLLEKLSKAHKLKTNDYLNKLAEYCLLQIKY